MLVQRLASKAAPHKAVNLRPPAEAVCAETD